jgi:hypothetical protein
MGYCPPYSSPSSGPFGGCTGGVFTALNRACVSDLSSLERETSEHCQIGIESDTLDAAHAKEGEPVLVLEPSNSRSTDASLESETPVTKNAPPPIQLRVQGRTVTLRESQPLTGTGWDKMIEILKMFRPEDG